MASSYVFSSSRFPNGTAVYATPANGQHEPFAATMANGSAVFAGLAEFQDYRVHGVVSGVNTDDRFTAPGAINVLSADPAVPDGASDNTAYLTGLNATAVVLGAVLRIPAGTRGNWCIRELSLASGTRIDATGATFVLPAGVSKRFLVNPSLMAASPGAVRDTNIEWKGGTFNRGLSQNALSLDDMCFMFGFVDGLVLSGITLVQVGTGGQAGTGGRYGLYLYGVTRFKVEDWTGSSSQINQGTIQLYGGCSDGHIKGVYGTFGDDCVALVPRDLAADEISGQVGIGDIHHVQIEDIFSTAQSNGVKLLGGSTAGSAPFYNTRDIRVRNVDGIFGANGNCGGAFIGGDTNYSSLTNGFVINCEIDTLRNQRASTAAVRFRDSGNVQNITLRGCVNSDTSTAIFVDAGIGTLSTIKIVDTVFKTTQTSGSYFPISILATVRSLVLENLRMDSATTGTASVGFLTNSATIGTLNCNNLKTTGLAYGIGNIANSCAVFAHNVSGEDVNMKGWFIAAGGTINVFEWSGQNVGTAGFASGAGTVVSLDPRFQVDLSNTSMSRPANSVAYNTNAGLACGAGPVISNGTSWKHLYTGTTY